MDTAPDPRPDLTAAQRIAIALGTAEDPRTTSPAEPVEAVDALDEAPLDPPA